MEFETFFPSVVHALLGNNVVLHIFDDVLLPY